VNVLRAGRVVLDLFSKYIFNLDVLRKKKRGLTFGTDDRKDEDKEVTS